MPKTLSTQNMAKKSSALPWIIAAIVVVVIIVIVVILWLFVFRSGGSGGAGGNCSTTGCSLAVPTNVIVQGGDGSIVIAFLQPDDCADFWEIYGSDTPGVTENSTLIATVTSPSYVAQEVPLGTYYFKIRAGRNAPQGCRSALTTEYTATVSTCTIPDAPTLSNGGSCGTGCVGATWTSQIGATGYNAYLKYNSDPVPPNDYDVAVELASTSSSYQFMSQPPSTALHYGVTAYNHCGESALSNVHVEVDP